MSFFDDIGTKLTQTGQKARKTAGDLVGAAKLTTQAGEQQKAIQALYEKLGEQYYQLHGKSPENALRELCVRIQGSIAELEQMKADLQRLKNVRVCPHCGHENSMESRFCSQCSAQLPELPAREPRELFCPSCGNRLPADASFCSKCGTKVTL